MKTHILPLLLIITVLTVAGCRAPSAPPAAETPGAAEPAEVIPLPAEEIAYIVQSERPRSPAPESALGDLPVLVNGNSAFAFDLYQALRTQPGNLFYSPYSISLALAMTYAGARGETEVEMAEVLHFNLPHSQLHPAFNKLDETLNQDVEGVEQPFQLNIANSIWGQRDFDFEADFLDVLAENYGAGLRLVDFIHAAEAARQQINTWVEDETQDKIKDLIPEDALDSMTRLVLANAIYFKAAWQNQFEAAITQEAPFILLDGSQVDVPTMRQTESMNYASGEGWQAVELVYEGGRQSMVILLPAKGEFEEFEAGLDAARVEEILKAMAFTSVELSLPRFSFESDIQLDGLLAAMGMPQAFAADQADFSGMRATRDLYISAILHKAFVDVNEEGTEAAAATAVIVSVTSLPVDIVQMQIDRPFIFMIRDTETNSILFAGRVINPLE
ncbi:MAG TPA: serpin family protein [Levilinea sp.]|nr:serpin family protein [Levilinea sp.]